MITIVIITFKQWLSEINILFYSKFAAGVVDTGGKFAAGVVDTGGNGAP